MIEPKDKAKELVDFFFEIKTHKLSDYSRIYLPSAKMFAKKVCDEVLEYMYADKVVEYWKEVKREIDKI